MRMVDLGKKFYFSFQGFHVGNFIFLNGFDGIDFFGLSTLASTNNAKASLTNDLLKNVSFENPGKKNDAAKGKAGFGNVRRRWFQENVLHELEGEHKTHFSLISEVTSHGEMTQFEHDDEEESLDSEFCDSVIFVRKNLKGGRSSYELLL